MGSSLRPRAARLMSPHPHAELGLAGLHEEMRPSDLTFLLPPEVGMQRAHRPYRPRVGGSPTI